jgi:hypothetical protein
MAEPPPVTPASGADAGWAKLRPRSEAGKGKKRITSGIVPMTE